MTWQIITSPQGERMVILPEADYLALRDAAASKLDGDAIKRFLDAVDHAVVAAIGAQETHDLETIAADLFCHEFSVVAGGSGYSFVTRRVSLPY